MVKEEYILEAYQNCLSGKASSPDAIRFIVNLFENITDLTEAINSRTYEPLPSITFVVSRPVYREVFAANFRDRVIHHYIALRLEPLFEGVFSDRTFNCRKGKGQLYGVRQLAADIKECSHDFTRPCWYVKCDMKGFFMSIPRKALADKVDRFIVKNYKGDDIEDLRYLSRVTIMNDPTKNCIRRSPEEIMKMVPPGKTLRGAKPGHGLPIGNLTSQHDANFWLNDFDWLFDIFFHAYFYGRYVDDFYVIYPSKQALLRDLPKIRARLADLGAILHPKKIEIQSVYKGIAFTGMVVKRDRIYASNRMVSNFEQLIHYMNTLPEGFSIETLQHYVCSINSYLGLMRHCNSYDIRKRIMLKMDNRFYQFLYIKGRYECVRIKQKLKRDLVNRKLLRNNNSRNFDLLMNNYYGENKNHKSKPPYREGIRLAS